MSEDRMVSTWNKKFGAGRPVLVDGSELSTKTLTTARIVNGVAMIYLADPWGPMALNRIRPMPRPAIEEVL